MQSIQFLSVLVAVILHSQSATAIVPIFRCDGHGERTAPYCIQPGTETQYLSLKFYCSGTRYKEGSGACCRTDLPFKHLTPVGSDQSLQKNIEHFSASDRTRIPPQINGVGLIKNVGLPLLCDVL
ncbi:hypothetical protein PSHT_00786 [Puccinia striiformis]|uniref:Secreted protein n=1 Tax=Puccinia striiformis TaxID=27350 RepID=A0A2S4WM31_9BASI|nr:hypothetical protein PSHT_00786 [Puccinia striiformis]